MHYFGIIGYGAMASYHHKRIDKPADVCYKAAYDIRPERLKKAEEDGLTAYTDLDEMLADPQLEAILVATPNDSHKELVIRSLRKACGTER